MRTLTTTLMASAMALVAFQAAHAADVVDEVPAAPAAEYTEPAVRNWSGAYVGGTIDWHHGEADATGNNKSVGFGGGLYGGYNVQDGQMVYGGEADVNYTGNDARSSGRRVKQGVNGSVRGRVGVDLNPVLVYGTAGVALGNAKLSTPAAPTTRLLSAGPQASAPKPSSPTTHRRVPNTATRITAPRTSAPAVRRFVGTTSTASNSGMGVKF